jgi:hypothetical protein
MLYLVPRVLMGILAVIDTFLVYKISERRYNRNVAVIVSVLFAVMPMTWLLRRILLDSILLPFLLSSILFAVYYNSNNRKNSKAIRNNKEILTILLSGIFLGIAIFTKIPAFTMIPLVAFLLVYNGNNNRNSDNTKNVNKNKSNITEKENKSKALVLWLIPVILIPLIRPIYSLAIGQFNLWIDGVILQTQRQDKALLDSVNALFQIDPILLIIGTAGIIFSTAIKRDFIFLLWVVPFVVFFASIALVQYFYWILVLPAFCIAAARLIEYISSKITHTTATVIVNSRMIGRRGGEDDRDNSGRRRNNNNVIISKSRTNNSSQRLLLSVLPFTIVSGIGIFGLISTALLVTTNVNNSYFNIYSFIVQHLPDRKEDNNSIPVINSATKATSTDVDGANNANKVTVVGRHYIRAFYWIPKYIFHKDFDFIDPHFNNTVKTQNILFVLDNPMSTSINRHNELKDVDPGYLWQYLEDNYGTISYRNRIKIFYDITNEIARYGVNTVHQDFRYAYTSMTVTPGINQIEIRANY